MLFLTTFSSHFLAAVEFLTAVDVRAEWAGRQILAYN